MNKKRFPLPKVYGLLEPGPVLLLTTAHRGQRDVMPMSWHSLLGFDPPLVSCVVSAGNESQKLLKASGQGVLNIPTAELARQVVGCGNCHASQGDKFERFGLAHRPASQVAAPLLDDCYASLECQVVDTRMVRRYELFVLEVVAAWVDASVRDPRTLHHRGYGRFMVAGDTLRLPSKMR
jgi:flavin reductase (DIM6/NTAB) family NADH-FMN oxidoreductase RutF